MRLNRSNSRPSPLASGLSPSKSGVALVITVVMISIITFLAVAFLTLTGRERGSVRTAIDAAVTRNATDIANDRAKAEIIAAVLATTNIANIDLLVSTNFFNPNGFDPALPPGFAQLQNVNYDYQNDPGLTPLTTDHYLRNQTNLFYNARPPVFITNRLTGGYEFRYYIDLNRNGRFDRTGFWPVTNLNGTFYGTDGSTNPIFTPTVAPFILSNYTIGDPQWIGVLDRSDKTHSADNQFVARVAYIVVPEGKTLDINYIGNSALTAGKPRMNALGRDFFRNQGVGTWEINFAAFLYDLNTNSTYGWGLGNSGYQYDPLAVTPQVGGNAFADAFGFYRYQLNGLAVGGPTDFAYSLPAFGITYGATAATLFRRDQMDGYTDGPLQTAINYAPEPPFGANADETRNPWVGANRPFRFFTTQDLFDPNKVNRAGIGMKFTDRLYAAGTNISTYDQNTFYRMLSQIGADSYTEEEDKLNLNYVNVGGLKVTNFISWLDPNYNFVANHGVRNSELFFTNAVDRLLRETSAEWFRAGPSNYLVTYFGYFGYTNLDEVGLTNRPYSGMTNQLPTLSMTNFPVMWEGSNYVYSLNTNRTGNRQFAYNLAVHRLLQVSANIWDTKTNARAVKGLPTVFRPVFRLQGNSLFITNFVEETSAATIALNTQNQQVLDIFALTNLTTANPPFGIGNGNVLIYGVPPVVGARKGLPNFNEFNSEVLLTMTRKLQVHKSGRIIDQTNQLFTMSVTMPTAVEFWNSYAANYGRQVSIFVTNDTTMVITNDLGVNFPRRFITGDRILSTNNWRGYNNGKTDSFIVMMRTNVPFITNNIYRPDLGPAGFKPLTPPNYDVSKNLLMPRWGVVISNRVHAMIVAEPTKEIIDYVLLGDMVYQTNWTDAICTPRTVGRDGVPTAASENILFQQLWATNESRTVPGKLASTNGVASQIYISLGQAGLTAGEIPSGWDDYLKQDTTDTVGLAITKFREFFYTTDTNGFHDVPFSPSVQFRVPLRWEANDPLVHYMSDDLIYSSKSGIPGAILPPVTNPPTVLEGIGKKNDRYRPWPYFSEKGADGGDTDATDEFNPSLKDPLVRSSDDWSFPTNTLPTVGWLGRVHRGTPWQTVYLKAANMGLGGAANSMTNWLINVTDSSPQARWANHAGGTVESSFYNRPVVDHVLFDVFTTALNENSTRGQLPINQTGLAAWSAVFSGMVALTNIGVGAPLFSPLIIQPAGSYDLADPSAPVPPIVRIVTDINATRGNTNLFPQGSFSRMADILNVPSLSFGDPVFVPDNVADPLPRMGTYYWTNESPFLNFGVTSIRERSDTVPVPKSPEIQNTLNDAAYEWLPQQAMSLLQLGKPRFVIYAYGQSLQPAPNSIVTASGPFFGLCTNYTITAEQVTRTVVEIKGTAKAPRVEVKSYNILGPD